MPTFERRMTSSTRAQDVAQWDVDRELVARAQAGDAVAFELLVVKYQRRVAALVRSLVRRADITEELTQEVFIDAYDHLADLRAGVAFWAWLGAIARNVASAYLRRPQTRMDADAAGIEAGDNADALQFAASPEQEAIAKELFATIDRSVGRLPANQRDALLLREVDGLDYRAIAATLSVPVNTVRSLIFRAREAIAAEIRPYLSSTRSRRW
jgi:RNA polymerase sigma-70 factor (ECF subfamily)